MVKVGDVVISTQGRDKDKLYVVVGVDRYVFVSDGNVHKLAYPKKKNSKHIKFVKSTNCIFSNLHDCDIIYLLKYNLKNKTFKEDC